MVHVYEVGLHYDGERHARLDNSRHSNGILQPQTNSSRLSVCSPLYKCILHPPDVDHIIQNNRRRVLNVALSSFSTSLVRHSICTCKQMLLRTVAYETLRLYWLNPQSLRLGRAACRSKMYRNFFRLPILNKVPTDLSRRPSELKAYHTRISLIEVL